MTDRLTDLMHLEASHLDVPAPRADLVLTRGRGLRRRRRTTTGVAALAALAVVATGAVLATGAADRDRAVEPAAPTPTQTSAVDVAGETGAAFAVGNRVYVADGTRSAVVDDPAVKSIYYTSAGVLVRHGDDGSNDGGGDQRFSLVAPDGTLTRLDVATFDTVHATDPAQPYLAWARTVGGVRGGPVEVVVHDVTTDEDVAVVPVPGVSADYLPVAIWGDLVYLGADGDDVVVDWRTGEVSRPGVVRNYPRVLGGRAATYEDSGAAMVVDATTGEELVRVDTGSYSYLELAPDGKHARSIGEGEGDGFDVYDLDTGDSVRLPGQTYDYGWTADGDLFRLDGATLVTCSAATAECRESPVSPAPVVSDDVLVRLGGLTYES